MNNNIEKIIKIAESVGLKELACKVALEIEKVNSREKVHVAFVGGQNSGKTTVINAVTGRTVREPSNISENELPLRVVFEKCDADDRFECVEVYDKAWNEEDAVLFELKSDEIAEKGIVKDIAHEIDVVYFIISAMNAFTSEDVETIKALSNHNVKLIVTKLDTIDDKNKAGVTKYINDVRMSLGLEEPIFIDKTVSEDVGKIVRNNLPNYTELKELREKYSDTLSKNLSERIEKEIEKEIAELDLKSKLQKDAGSNHEAYSDALRAKNKLMELGLARSKRYESATDLKNKLTKTLIDSGNQSSYSKEWQDDIKSSIIVPLIKSEFETERKKIQELLFDDCIGINSTEEESRELRNAISSLSKIDAEVSDIPSQKLKVGESSINLKTVGITAAVVAGAVLIPIPTLATWIVSVGAIAVGAGAVIAEKAKGESDMWIKNIKDYSTVVSKQFYESMIIYNNDVYGKLADYVYEKMMKSGETKAQARSASISTERERYENMLVELKKI